MSENPNPLNADASANAAESISIVDGRSEDTASQLKEIFADLREFEVGELSRLCISKDYFQRPKA